MLEPITKTLQEIADLWAWRQTLIEFCADHPVLAGLVIFMLVTVSTFILMTNVIQFIQKLSLWMQSAWGRAAVGLCVCIVSVLSAVTVIKINNVFSAKPVFAGNIDRVIIGQLIRLTWSYAKRNEIRKILFQVESANDIKFTVNVIEEGFADGYIKPITRPINAARYWRVRAVEAADEHMPASGWSDPILITRYDDLFARIAATKSFSIYLSNSINQGEFKYLLNNGNYGGFDIKLSKALADKLPAKMGIDGPLVPVWNPVPWQELLKSPTDGRADMIISAITKQRKREENFKIRFSIPYYMTHLSLIYRCRDPDLSSAKRLPIKKVLEGRLVGVPEDTTSESLLTELRMEQQSIAIQKFREVDEMVAALVHPASEINYVVADTPFALAEELQNNRRSPVLGHRELKENDFPASMTPEEYNEEYAVAVRDTDGELIKAINDLIGEMDRDGELKDLREQAAKEYQSFIRPEGIAGGLTGC